MYLSKGMKVNFDEAKILPGAYRPFCKAWLYFDKHLNHRVSQLPKAFPYPAATNKVICVCGPAAGKSFSALITDTIPNFHFHDTSQCFPQYLYNNTANSNDLFATSGNTDYKKINNISNAILQEFKALYKIVINEEDIFYYIYGILHSPEYKTRFESDLKKMIPRIPFAEDFWAFSKAGRTLTKWHLNYETVDPYPLKQSDDKLALYPKDHYRVQKMYFGKNSKEVDKTTILYNSHITLSGIPLEAYDYVVNGRPALEWIIERY